MNKDKITDAIKTILLELGEDPNREGLVETPDRVYRMYQEIFSGYNQTPKQHLQKQFKCDNCEIVLEKDITFYSMCEHHMMPFYGKAHVAYIPNKTVVGLSKIARTVEVFAKRLQIQEQLTQQIADAIMSELNAKGAMVVLQAEHMCMTMRGVKKPGSKTLTVATRGQFADNLNLQNNVFSQIK